MSDISAFFGQGYSSKKKEKPKPKTDFPEIKPSDESKVAINVMGKLYEGMKSIEMCQGDVFVDGYKSGRLPMTSGTWFLILKGELEKMPLDEKNISRIVEKCGII